MKKNGWMKVSNVMVEFLLVRTYEKIRGAMPWWTTVVWVIIKGDSGGGRVGERCSSTKGASVWMALALVAGIVVTGCVGEKISGQQLPEEKTFTPATSPIRINLIISDTLKLNKPVELIANVSSLINASNTTVNVDLPEGFVLLGGDLSWKGNLIENQLVQIKSTIKPVKTGEWKIEGFVKNIVTEDSWWIDSDIIYISIEGEGIVVRKTPIDFNNNNNNNKTNQQTLIEVGDAK